MFCNYRVAEETISCPFNKAHQITGKRYHVHVVKCAKQNAGRDVKICPFNSKHVIDVPKFAHHVERCPDKDRLERYLSERAKLLEETTMDMGPRAEPVQTAPGLKFSGPDEDWEADCRGGARRPVTASYDPQEAIAGRDVFRFPQDSMGKSARRQFRASTVALLRSIQNDEPAAGSGAASSAAASAGRLRRPRQPSTTSLAVAPHSKLGRGQKSVAVPLPVGLAPRRPGGAAQNPQGAVQNPACIGRGRGRKATVVHAVPGVAKQLENLQL